jgi:hypothetical protein
MRTATGKAYFSIIATVFHSTKMGQGESELYWYVTKDESNGTKQGCTLPRADQMAPSKAERYHRHVNWHQARLYITTGRPNGTLQAPFTYL